LPAFVPPSLSASLRILAVGLGAAALATLLASGPGTRLGLWDWRAGLGLLRYAAYLGIGASVVSLVALVIPPIRRGHARALLLALALGLVSLAPPVAFQRQARSVPAINDISTDAENKIQKDAYPDIRPIMLAVPPQKAFERALAAAQAMGWEIVARDPAAGRIEAVDTTFWFGFKDDVVVRVAAAPGGGSRVDVRSRSRVGRGDAGTNARRIRGFRERLS
jgi:uncharacterized protein (DUF1499 family)